MSKKELGINLDYTSLTMIQFKKFGNEEDIKSLIWPFIKDKAESQLNIKFSNFFIIKYESYGSLNEKIDPMMRVYWSADNYPNCQKIYANNCLISLTDLNLLFRLSKLDNLLN